jgi:AcrR family transcriptional regulator
MERDTTSQKIARAALAHLLRQGIKKTSLEEVAHSAGLTRITVYRYFQDKKELVTAALMSIPTLLETVQADLQKTPGVDLETILERVVTGITNLPEGDLPALLDELRRVYPDVWESFHQRRVTAMEAIFEAFFNQAGQRGVLRQDLNRQVIKTFFVTSVVQVLENPALTDLGLSAKEIFTTVKEIFLYGILQEKVG